MAKRRKKSRAERRAAMGVPDPAPAPPPDRERTPEDGSRGRLARQWESEDSRKFLECLQNGAGRDTACVMLGIRYERFLKQFNDDEDFRNQVLSTERHVRQMVHMTAWDLAVTDKNVMMLIKFLDREDRGYEFAANMEQRREEFRVRTELDREMVRAAEQLRQQLAEARDDGRSQR
jgi:hypothetical protein